MLLLVGGAGAFGCLLPVRLALLLAPRSPLLGIELAVVIDVDLIEALAVELVTLLGRHRRQLVVIGLTSFESPPLGRRHVGCRALLGEAGLALPPTLQTA